MNDRLKRCSEHLKAMWLEKCHELLTAAGVPEWVEVNSMPGNAVPLRLEWYLSRRKRVTEAEKDGVCSELNDLERGTTDGQTVTAPGNVSAVAVSSGEWLAPLLKEVWNNRAGAGRAALRVIQPNDQDQLSRDPKDNQ